MFSGFDLTKLELGQVKGKRESFRPLFSSTCKRAISPGKAQIVGTHSYLKPDQIASIELLEFTVLKGPSSISRGIEQLREEQSSGMTFTQGGSLAKFLFSESAPFQEILGQLYGKNKTIVQVRVHTL